MEKINHAERVRGEAKEQTTYCGAAFSMASWSKPRATRRRRPGAGCQCW